MLKSASRDSHDRNRNMTEAGKSAMGSPSVRKVFIQRDYSLGTNVRFQLKFPPELEGLIERQLFEHLINTLNSIYSEAERMSYRTCCEGCFGCLTAYVAYVCLETYYSKCLKRIAAFIDEQNDTVWKPRGLFVTDPIERGLRVIEITIFGDRPDSADLVNNRSG